jgi:hypothetical protein
VGKHTVRIDESATTHKILWQGGMSRMRDDGLFVPVSALPSQSAPFDLIAVECAFVTKKDAKQVLQTAWTTASAAACPPVGSGDGDAD